MLQNLPIMLVGITPICAYSYYARFYVTPQSISIGTYVAIVTHAHSSAIQELFY